MEKKAVEYIYKNRLFTAGDHVLIGLSGGADSLALFYFLDRVKERLGIRLGAAHLHHGLRQAEADRDQAFSEALCQKAGVPFYTKKEDVALLARDKGMTVEEAGREARHRFFRAIQGAEGYDKLALGHHLDDQAETVLMRMLRGTGVGGAAGMRPLSKAGDLTIVRPLLGVSKAEILAYCQKNKLDYCTDSTNFESEPTRNKLRLEVTPALLEINPGAQRHLAAFGELAGAYEDFLSAYIRKIEGQVIRRENNRVFFKIEALCGEHPLVQSILLREGIKKVKGSLKEIEYNHVSGIVRQLEAGKTVWDLHLPHGIWVKRRYDALWMEINEPKKDASEGVFGTYPILPDKAYYFAKEHLSVSTVLFPEKISKKPKEFKNHSEIFFDYGRIRGTLYLRSRRTGDFFKPVGLKGRKKIKDYFIDSKISRELRDKIPLLSLGSEVLWIVGYAAGRDWGVSSETAQTLQVVCERILWEKKEEPVEC